VGIETATIPSFVTEELMPSTII